MTPYAFKSARPVWADGLTREMNCTLAFRAILSGGEATLAVAASGVYQLFVNGILTAEGPARTGHGSYRADEIPLTLPLEKNVLVLYVNNAYVPNFYMLCADGFLCAEVRRGTEILAATGVGGFDCRAVTERYKKVARFSYQRTFAEAYRLTPATRTYETDLTAPFESVPLAECGEKRFIARDVPYPSYEYYPATATVSAGKFTPLDKVEKPNRDRYITLEDNTRGFAVEDLEILNSDEADKCVTTEKRVLPADTYLPVIGGNEFAVYKLAHEQTGFLNLAVSCESETRLVVSFDELLTDNEVNIRRFRTQGVIVLDLAAGNYNFTAFEPNVMQYIKVANRGKGRVRVSGLGLTAYQYDLQGASLGSEDAELNKIFDAAVRTFRQNTVDVYMDCPSRERAGWLCDSFFTSRTEFALTGKSVVERAFLENFLIAEGFTDIDPRMFAMCYPSDHASKRFIPNWAMWYVLELEEYFKRTGDRTLIDEAEKRVLALCEFFSEYENEDGLLEHLPSWVFLEWSAANSYTQDVNYPSNMLYARMLRAVGNLYGGAWAAKADKIDATVREQSFRGGFFRDHAVRENGVLVLKEADVTETCQYYAFFCGTATPETYPELWARMLNEFGADKVQKGLWKEIAPANAFIGYYLRLDLLDRFGKKEQLLRDIKGFFGQMADLTGTLWENKTLSGSCNHGFASHVAVWLLKWR